MAPDENSSFSWPLLFIVTAGSFLIFGLLIKLLDGNPVHVSIFFKTGIVALGLSLVSTIASLISKKATEE